MYHRLIPRDPNAQVSWKNPAPDSDRFQLAADRVGSQIPGRRMTDNYVVWHFSVRNRRPSKDAGRTLLSNAWQVKPLSVVTTNLCPGVEARPADDPSQPCEATHAAIGDVSQVNFFRLTRMQPWTDRTLQLLRIKFVSRRGAAG
jgi:hypothetical protein